MRRLAFLLIGCSHSAGPSAVRSTPTSAPASSAAPPLPAISGGEVGCFAWFQGPEVYACARVVEWPGDRCVAIDLVGQTAVRSVPVEGGARCGDAVKQDAARLLAEQGPSTPVQESTLVVDAPVNAAGIPLILRNGDRRE